MKRFALILLTVLGSSVHGSDWPAWRGPTGQGFSEEKNLPLKWSDKNNVKWKVSLSEEGNSTPVVWGDKTFLTQATKGGAKRSLLCLARADGKLIWQKDVEYAEKERNWAPTWYSNASPALDAERAVVSFASAGIFCFGHDGKELWKRTDLGRWEHAFGSGASPILYGDLAILWCGPNDPKGKNFLLAVNKRNGETVWEQEQTYGSWSTPVIARVNDQDQLILGHSRDVKGQPEDNNGYLRASIRRPARSFGSVRG
jgi:outer membrane protein assembly factor BamB